MLAYNVSYFVCVVEQVLILGPSVGQQQLFQLACVRLRIILLEAYFKPTSLRPRHADAVEVIVDDVFELRNMVNPEDVSEAVVVLRQISLFVKFEQARGSAAFAHHFQIEW